ncbi:MAG: hypothetical protein QM740_19130 [Acidovorax sp.]
MTSALLFFRLAAMRHRADASLVTSLYWAADLLWRSHQTARHRRQLEHRAQVKHTPRQHN